MGLLFGGERRDWFEQNPIPLNSERGTAFSTSKPPDLTRTEANLQKIAVYAAVKLLMDIASTMPLDFFTRAGDDGKGKRPIPMPPWLADLGGEGYGLGDWLAQVTYTDALRGNVIGKVLARDPQSAKPRQISLQHPDSVDVQRDPQTGLPVWTINGRRVEDRTDVWHRRSFPIPGKILGVSPIGAHALTVGLGLAAEKYAATFLAGGGHPTAIFQNKAKKLDPEQSGTIKRRIMGVLMGSREPLVLGADWDYKAIQISPADSAYLETAGFSSSEAARIFGPGMPAVLGYETGSSMTYANVEQFNQQLLTFTLNPWLVRLERMLYDLLPAPQFARFNRKALLQTDLLSRYRAHELALRNKFTTVNRVLDVEDEQPLPWGDAEPAQAAPTPTVKVEE